MEQNPPRSSKSIFLDRNEIQKKESEERLEKMKTRRNKKLAKRENGYLNPSTPTSMDVDKPNAERTVQTKPKNRQSKEKMEKEKQELSRKILTSIENLEQIENEKREQSKRKYFVAQQLLEMIQQRIKRDVFIHTTQMCLNGATEYDVKRWIVELDSYIRDKCLAAAGEWWGETDFDTPTFINCMEDELKNKINNKNFRFFQKNVGAFLEPLTFLDFFRAFCEHKM